MNDLKKAKEIYEYLITKHPHFIEAFHSYWRFLQKNKEVASVTKLAQKALESSEHPSVPTSLWVETRILTAKTFIFNDNVAKAISTLKEICYILPPFPLDNLEFI